MEKISEKVSKERNYHYSLRYNPDEHTSLKGTEIHWLHNGQLQYQAVAYQRGGVQHPELSQIPSSVENTSVTT
jgi:hypothetical protein